MDDKLYEYFEYTGLPLKKIKRVYGEIVLENYLKWICFNLQR